MLANLIDGKWVVPSKATPYPIYDPSTGEVIEEVPLSEPTVVDAAVKAAQAAQPMWAAMSLTERVARMFRFKALLESRFEDLALAVTRNHGKTLDEARGEVRRGIDVVDFACGAPTLLQGRTLREVSTSVDQDVYRFPIGVAAGIPPFNFPVMIPLWMFPLAIVAGNTFVLKPSERTPLGAALLAELVNEIFPPGVFNMVHGASEAAEALITHDGIQAVSFVGSEPVARRVYEIAAAHHKRVQAAGGAKNHIIVMDDADLDLAVPAIIGSAFGNAGERCLAGSVVLTVGHIGDELLPRLQERAEKLVIGPGTDQSVELGPLVRAEHRQKVVSYIEKGISEGAHLLLDGRALMERPGFFLGPTILNEVSTKMSVGREEIFGPVLSVASTATLREAIERANTMELGNMAAIFTSNGKAAHEFRESIEAGMVGINVGVAQPFAFYPFSGWKRSFYGDLHIEGTDGIEFYTKKKVVVSRW
jgi:malonate-semialdehyde dehydrogenase (acetylating)/methylmalonate-semialdehyde dehydrogenase